MSVKIAAVVPCRNRKDKTLRFLREMTQQTYTASGITAFDIIVVDANSSDGTVPAIQQHFPQVILLSVGDESYWTASTNTGIRYALQRDYDYILTINDDATISPHYVADLLTIAQRHHRPLLASRIDYLGHPGLIWALGTQVTWGIRLLQLQHHNRWEADLPTALRQADILDVEAAPGNGVLIHRSVFEQIGLYQERWLPHYHADSEFIMRAHQHGLRPGVTPQVVVYDDSPVPQAPSPIANAAPPLNPTTFRFTFFHRRSGWLLWPRLYLVWNYCPWPQKLPTLIQATLIAMLGWLIKQQTGRFRRSLNLLKLKGGPLPIR